MVLTRCSRCTMHFLVALNLCGVLATPLREEVHTVDPEWRTVSPRWKVNSQYVNTSIVNALVSFGDKNEQTVAPIQTGKLANNSKMKWLPRDNSKYASEMEFSVTDVSAGQKARLEGTTCFATADDLRAHGVDPTSEVARMYETLAQIPENCSGAAKAPSAEIPTEAIIEYDLWLAPDFPSNAQAIIGQFHGRPDSRIVFHPLTNETRRLSLREAYDACTAAPGRDNISCIEGNITAGPYAGWQYKQGGYPPLSFGLAGSSRHGPPVWYVVGRSDDRMFIPRANCGFDPANSNTWINGTTCPGGSHEHVAGIWRGNDTVMPRAQWVSFKWTIRWSAYAQEGGALLSNGSVGVVIDGGRIANVSWVGPIGRHDDGRAPYFKLGVYDPSGSTAPTTVRFRNFAQSFRVLTPQATNGTRRNTAPAGAISSISTLPTANTALRASWMATVSQLLHGDTPSFHAALTPLMWMVTLTYVDTRGSYNNASTASQYTAMLANRGWTPMALREDPDAGLHALLFLHNATGRGVVAFRGTDLDVSRKSGQADACADALLAGAEVEQLPAFCSKFAASMLDYVADAMAFADKASTACNKCDLLFTGHSLGAQLAVVVGALRKTQSVVVSSPPVADLLWARFNVNVSQLVPNRTIILANADDPVYFEAHGREGLLGTQCLWTRATPLASCAACFAGRVVVAPSTHPACMECFEHTHVFGNYLHTSLPGARPACKRVQYTTRSVSIPQPTLVARRGRTPTLDGHVDTEEWKDATAIRHVAPAAMAEFSPVTNSSDLAVTRGWVKYDNHALYFAFDIVDDVAYGIDTPAWIPAGNPRANMVNRSGWSWFGDEIELIMDAQPAISRATSPDASAIGNASQWQIVVNTIKSTYGGFGRGGLLPGEPNTTSAYALYDRWIADEVMKAVVLRRNTSTGSANHGYSIEWRIGFDALHTAKDTPFNPNTRAVKDTLFGLNIAIGDVDIPAVGDARFGIHHENWIAGDKRSRTTMGQLAQLWLAD
eukprot:m.673117 g.673117  ORF g.673117 m.673117 type:complete len:1004 (+) comp22779_c0_seq1:150-3161(+)